MPALVRIRRREDLFVRFSKNISFNKKTECWDWIGHTHRLGYGLFSTGSRFWKTYRLTCAHIISYEFYRCKVPSGMELDHLCRNRKCVNPAHLEPVTHQENVLRGTSIVALNAEKKHCKRNHELNFENTKVLSNGHRLCIKCNKAHQKKYKLKKFKSICMPIESFLTLLVLPLFSCSMNIIPSEMRYYDPIEIGCTCSKLPSDTTLDRMWLIGRGRFERDQARLDTCAEVGLIQKEP